MTHRINTSSKDEWTKIKLCDSMGHTRAPHRESPLLFVRFVLLSLFLLFGFGFSFKFGFIGMGEAARAEGRYEGMG